MPKMQVYLPAELHARVKARADRLNVSSIVQAALQEALAELDRRQALDEVIRDYEGEHGKFTEAQLAAQEAADRAAAIRPLARRKRRRRTSAA